jgi:hypothetical protein
VIILDNGCIIGDGRPEDLSPDLLYGSIKDDDNHKDNDNDDDSYNDDDNDNDSSNSNDGTDAINDHNHDHSRNNEDEVRFDTIYNNVNDDVDCIPITSSYKYRGNNSTNNNKDINDENKNDNDDKFNEDNDNDTDKLDSEIFHQRESISDKNRPLSSSKKNMNDKDEMNNDILKEKTKLLILKETMKKGDVDINVYLKYFGACYQQSGYSIFNENPDPNPVTGADTDKNEKTQNKFVFNLKSSLLILGLLLVFSIAQVLNVGINYCLARWAQYGGSADGSLLNNNYSKAYYIFFGVLFIFLFIRSAYLNTVASYSAQHIYR